MHTRRLLVVAVAMAMAGMTAMAAVQNTSKKPADVAAEKKDPAADINTPRADARHIAFDVDEGTWMSVDVSPDGKTIAFDLLGDIYTIPIGGGTATAVSRGPAWDQHPRFSPDGGTIAFTSDEGGMENLWLMDANGQNRRALVDDKNFYIRSASWTPDGNYLVARKEDGRKAGIPPVELWLYHRYGGAGIKLTSSDEMNNAAGPVVSRDGRFVYFAGRQRRFSYEPDLRPGLWAIMRYDRQTNETVPLTTGIGGAVRPALSPDGHTLTFISRRDSDAVLVARNLDTGAERIVARRLTKDDQEGFAAMDLWPGYSFTPDGRSVIVSSHGKLISIDLASGREQTIPFTAHVDIAAAPRVAWQDKVHEGAVQARILRWPSQSPDARLIAFDAFGRIWLQDIDGTHTVGAPRLLTGDRPLDGNTPREYAPAFSPDGKWLAFVTWSDRDAGHVWKVPVPAPGSSATATPQQLTRRAGHYANPAWSPKGDRLAVIQGSGLEFRGQQPEEENFFEIRWLDANGGETQPVTTVTQGASMNFHSQAFWSADGTRLFYRDPVPAKKPDDDPKMNLVSIRPDGTDKRAHLRLPPVDDLVPSPDEQWVAFTSRDNVYVTALPPIGTKEPAEVGLKEGSVPVWRLSDNAGGYVGWADGGRTITWSLGNQFHRLGVRTAIEFVEEEKRKAAEEKKAPAAKSGAADAKKAGDAKKSAATDAKDDKRDRLKVPASEMIELKLSVPAPASQGTLVFTNARVLTMKGDQVLEDADVVVRGDRIVAVGHGAATAVPPDAKRIDAHGKTIMPGIVDTHAHLHYSGFEIFPTTKWEYAANLAYGVTTVYDPSAPSLDVFAQAEMVEAGAMLGPRVYSSGDVLYGGQAAPVFAEVTSLEDARRQVRRMKAYGARMIKVYQQPRRDQRIWFAEACREEHMLLTAEGAAEMHTDLSMAIDGFTAFEHSLPYELHADVIQFLARSGTYYTPTLIVSYGGPTAEDYFWQMMNPHQDEKLNRFVPHRYIDVHGRRLRWISPDEYHFPIVARGAADVVRAGGHVTLGAHGQLQGLGAHWELWALAGEGGEAVTSDARTGGAMTPMQALQAATIASADKIGFAEDLGSIEPNKLADLVILDANPLDDIHNTIKIRFVMKNGELYEAETLTEQWPQVKPLPPFFWQEPARTTTTSQPQ